MAVQIDAGAVTKVVQALEQGGLSCRCNQLYIFIWFWRY